MGTRISSEQSGGKNTFERSLRGWAARLHERESVFAPLFASISARTAENGESGKETDELFFVSIQLFQLFQLFQFFQFFQLFQLVQLVQLIRLIELFKFGAISLFGLLDTGLIRR